MKALALISAALLLSLAGAANAQLTVYGLLDGSYGKSVGDDINDLKNDFHSGGDNGMSNGNSSSRFGLKGSTDVGAGIKANFNLQSNGITSDGDIPGNFFNRMAWLGFSGSFGEIRLGRNDSLAFQTMIDFDLNGASNGVSSFGYSGAAIWNSVNGRESRLLHYISPSFGGVKVQLGFVPKGNSELKDVNSPDPVNDSNKSTGSVSVSYNAGPLAVAGTYESKRSELSKRFVSVAGSYDFGVAKVVLGYADGGKDDALVLKARGYNAGVNVPIAGFNFGVQAGKNRDTKGLAYEIYGNKEILKNTIAYVEVGRADHKAVNYLTTSYLTAGAFAGPKDESATGFAVGVIYVF